jgi:hypothetical protein
VCQERKDLLSQVLSAHKTKPNSTVLKYKWLLVVTQAKDWAASEYGVLHNTKSDQEGLESSLPDHMTLHPAGATTKEDMKLHIHKVVSSIGLT